MHYVCVGACGKVSGKPGVCTTEFCSREEKPLAECNCTDGQHQSVIPPDEEKGEHDEND